MLPSPSVLCAPTDLSAWVVNPLVDGVGPVVVALIPSCNTFTAEEVAAELEQIRALSRKHLAPVLGPMEVLSSDGDQRRVRVQLLESCDLVGPGRRDIGSDVSKPGVRYRGIQDPSFVFSGLLEQVEGPHPIMLTQLHNQDSIHRTSPWLNCCASLGWSVRSGCLLVTVGLSPHAVDKRLFCGLGKPTKKYLLGRSSVDLATVRKVFLHCKAEGGLPALGLRESDLRYEPHNSNVVSWSLA
jgi:hypothetical protein